MRSIKRRLHDAIILKLRERFHSHRARLFVSTMKPPAGCRILDLGGSSGDFLIRLRDLGVQAQFVVADIDPGNEERAGANGFEYVSLDESAGLPFRDGEFDFVICNSVIEHVTLPKRECGAVRSEGVWQSASLNRQKIFADEIRRISRQYFVQSPHRNFPVEQHTILPFVNWLSHNQTLAVLRFTDRWWVRRGVFVDWNLLNTAQMAGLFPDATVMVERVLGMPKSIICYRTASS
jgi:hypothetical protein